LGERERRARERSGKRRRRRQGDLCVRAGDGPLLPRGGAAARAGPDLGLLPRRRPAVRPRAPGRDGGEGGRRSRRLRDAHRTPGERGRARCVPCEDPGGPAALRRAAADRALHLSDLGQGLWTRRPQARGPAAILAVREEWRVGAARRAHARRPRRGIVRRQLEPGRRLEGYLGDEAMISRVADHCFWFGRYLERTESTARLLQVTASLALDSELTPEQCWQPVVITAGEQERFAELCGPFAAADGDAVQRYLTLDERVPVSLRRSIAAARENARSSRDVISLDAWEIVNELHLYLMSPAAREDFEEHPYGFYRRIRREAQLCLGLLRATMLHDTPLYFCWLGVLLERVGQTARILDVQYHAFLAAESAGRGAYPIVEVSLWLSLLRACYGFEPFMKIHRGIVSAQPHGSIRSALVSAWERLESSIFLVLIRTARWGALTEANTQPFQRAWGRREWVIAHSGSLQHKLDGASRFEPVGSTDSEQVFC